MTPAANLPLITRVLRDWFTDATGQGYSVGRALGVWLIFVGVAMPVGIAVYIGWPPKAPAMPEWVSFLGALGPYWVFLATAAAAMILGTAPTDPGGAWWSRANAPPSTTTTTTVPPVTTTARTTTPAPGARNDLAE